ncbi:MAG: sugar ABC transporter permease [Clostridia bacterium]|nr:sugar ABC transporter permease [Clostridia bacterium]
MYILLIPGLIYAIVFKILPMLGIYIAFVDYNIFAGSSPLEAIFASEFVGFENFTRVFRKVAFTRALGNTFIISFMKIICVFPLPIIFALIIHSVHNRYFKKTVQTIIYLPHFFSWVVVAGIFTQILSSTGIVNKALMNMGVLQEPIVFLSNQSLFRWVLVFTDAWKEVGWGTIVYLAALSGVDQEMYEAAVIDGAKKFQQLIYITLPSIKSTILFALVMLTIGGFNVFTSIKMITDGKPMHQTEVVLTWMYNKAFTTGDFGYAAALSFIVAVTLVFLAILQFKAMKKNNEES